MEFSAAIVVAGRNRPKAANNLISKPKGFDLNAMDERKIDRSTKNHWQRFVVGGVTLVTPFFASGLSAQLLNGPAGPVNAPSVQPEQQLFRLPPVQDEATDTPAAESSEFTLAPNVAPVDEMAALNDFPTADEASEPDPTTENRLEEQSERDVNDAPPASFPVVSAAICQRAEQLIERGVTLADRGALYAGRAEVVQALRIIARAMDAEVQSDRFSQAMTDGFNALEEAKDFSTSAMEPTARPNLDYLVRSHRTPVFHDVTAKSTIQALQAYHAYAAEKLSIACGKNPTSSKAMFTLAKIDMLIAGDHDSELSGPRTMTFFQVALSADSNNSSAANELGVRFAKFGQYNDAKKALTHCVELEPTNAIAWQNLAKVHHFLGETELARAAMREMELAKSMERKSPSRQRLSINWVSPKQFSRGTPQEFVRPEKPSVARRMINTLGNGKKAIRRK